MDVFDSTLNSQVSKFKQVIMRDYWDYRRKPIEKNGFFCLETVSPEYLLLKFFEKRIEEYIRRYLVNGFLERVLKNRGNGIHPSCLPMKCDTNIFYSNKEYEQIVMYEFVIDSVISNNCIGVRYTEMPLDEELVISEDVDEIQVVLWNSFLSNSNQKREKTLLKNGKILVKESIYEFMMQHGFSEEEYQKYVTTLICVATEVQEILGVKSVPKLNSSLLFQYRFEIEHSLIEHTSHYLKYQDAEKNLMKSDPESVSNFNWAYQIIDPDNKIRYPNLEMQSKELLNGALSVFVDKKYYQVLIGKSDLARSFITSEYLHKQYDSNDQLDYTSIISGYLKSIEQLLYHISLSALNKNFTIKSSGKKLEDGSRAPYKVDFTSDNLEKGLCDTTMGALSYLIKESKKTIVENKKYKGYIFECLQCFIKECRNDSFHKHNIDKWSRVEKIRNNTIVLMIILLGICKLGDSQSEIEKKLKIVRNDKMERAYHWITCIKSETFKIQFNYEDAIEVRLGTACEYPSFDKWGFINDYMLKLECVNERDSITGCPKLIFIKRDMVPKKMWYFDKDANYHVWEC